MSLFWWSLLGYQHSSKKGVAADLGVDLAMGEAKDPGNNISTYHWFMPISNNPLIVSPHQTNTLVHTSNHKCSLHQLNRVDD